MFNAEKLRCCKSSRRIVIQRRMFPQCLRTTQRVWNLRSSVWSSVCGTRQGSSMAKQLGTEAYLECSAFTSEKSIHSVFRTASLACINKLQLLPKTSPTQRLSKRLLHLPSRSELLSTTFKKEKTKSCAIM
uniref:rho-related GTP-binding protein Rho6-like n=1 Tax=Oncorhynchus gorbuscha TaxID=8017 RepID=UPI001EAEF00A|nr:rho-related GTP-binding protein Rho6-like [Oncorhynchus gorbuscha]